MRSPDEDATTGDDGAVTSSLGDGFGASADDLTGGFGDGDRSEGFSIEEIDVDDGSDDELDFPGDAGDSLTDDEASNVLEEILEDLFGDDGPQVLDGADSFSEASTEPDFDVDAG